MNSRYLAFEITDTIDQNVQVMIYDLRQKQTYALFTNAQNKTTSMFYPIESVDHNTQMPLWSKNSESILYYLHTVGVDKENKRRIKSIDLIQQSFVIEKNAISYYDNGTIMHVGDAIDQESGISKYSVFSYDDEDYQITIEQDQFRDLKFDGRSMGIKIQKIEKFSSFDLTQDGSFVVCKGSGESNDILFVKYDFDEEEIKIIKILPIPRISGSIHLEPSLNPANSYQLAVLEFTLAKMVNKLYLYNIQKSEYQLIDKSIYSNKERQVARENKTSYAWHPNGNIIAYIDTNKDIVFADISDSHSIFKYILKTGISHPDQLKFSPDGKYLAIVALPEEQYLTNSTLNTFAQLYVVELSK